MFLIVQIKATTVGRRGDRLARNSRGDGGRVSRNKVAKSVCSLSVSLFGERTSTGKHGYPGLLRTLKRFTSARTRYEHPRRSSDVRGAEPCCNCCPCSIPPGPHRPCPCYRVGSYVLKQRLVSGQFLPSLLLRFGAFSEGRRAVRLLAPIIATCPVVHVWRRVETIEIRLKIVPNLLKAHPVFHR